MKKRMRTEQKSNVKNSIRRLAFVAISVLIQLVWILEQFIRLNRYSTAISLISSLLALLLVLTLLVGLMPAALAADTVDVSALPEYTADGADPCVSGDGAVLLCAGGQ